MRVMHPMHLIQAVTLPKKVGAFWVQKMLFCRDLPIKC